MYGAGVFRFENHYMKKIWNEVGETFRYLISICVCMCGGAIDNLGGVSIFCIHGVYSS